MLVLHSLSLSSVCGREEASGVRCGRPAKALNPVLRGTVPPLSSHTHIHWHVHTLSHTRGFYSLEQQHNWPRGTESKVKIRRLWRHHLVGSHSFLCHSVIFSLTHCVHTLTHTLMHTYTLHMAPESPPDLHRGLSGPN